MKEKRGRRSRFSFNYYVIGLLYGILESYHFVLA